ncbi:hypothetical protein C8E87_5132 [Paractinoplanes brasiliensis]|uniref:Uncharacterized protein n=1 Tax=Paractinoplanes brasiliensis TaxID=52695 RepID=A0A4R6JX91_9ACTN|nr:hypothetical protein C8E87_5132 [Actinoplanes brasiliensis]
MTAVARVLPRDWDGPRLLRFLTGLALLALAFAAHLAPAQLETAGHTSPAAATVTTADPASAAAAESAAAESAAVESAAVESAAVEASVAESIADQAQPAGFPLEATSVVVVLVTIAVLVGIAGRVRAVRGPPLA